MTCLQPMSVCLEAEQAATSNSNGKVDREPDYRPTANTEQQQLTLPPEQVHTTMWAMAETYFRQAQKQYNDMQPLDTPNDSCQANIIAGLSCLYGVLRLCESPKAQTRHFGTSIILSADTEARTRLRIAQVLAEWGVQGPHKDSNNTKEEGEENESEEERQLQRALLVVPKTDNYAATKYAIIAAQCRLLRRRREMNWAEQRLKATIVDAQQRRQYRWTQFFTLELSNMYFTNGNHRSALAVLQAATQQAQQNTDKIGNVTMAVQQLGMLVQMRNWVSASTLAGTLVSLMTDPELISVPQLRTRFWTLNSAAAAMRGDIANAQEICGWAREALKEWQECFASQIAEGRAADNGATFLVTNSKESASGSSLRIHGSSYYEAHVWVMLVSAQVLRGDDYYERVSGFLRLALEGITRGEANGLIKQLLPLKIYVLLRIVDINLSALFISEAKGALDRVMSYLASHDCHDNSLWRDCRDAVALRWAMYKHRIGDFDEAIEAYRCVARQKCSDDLCYSARVNLAVLYLSKSDPTDEDLEYVRQLLILLEKEMENTPGSELDKIRGALLQLVQGMGSKEPVKAKTYLLGCLRLCNEAAEATLQGWTLCLLGTMVLSTGQYEQAMKMCAASQSIAQCANDPLQNAAAIGILSKIEHAVGDPERCAQLMQVDKRLLQQFNAQIIDDATNKSLH
ncbi:hypothetical protein COEREDRAFT_79376 [Coemansia reversa NRRL 1564]|uniref:TPR-like protein n=1 Tax=Coemansia reversa (strain ATCC 12441 / NRRL 1564) TaxID=763665 RepID=A0A2G5BIK2_COERN|nr:hypothetical protein COEREDRAFT_79376 [Coemansia reversa NRRL 1564]|eukprot:PIA18811.1 hypothetical protein COEREDRAFT_79376 [Coemansia reversa NRRL 1564]